MISQRMCDLVESKKKKNKWKSEEVKKINIYLKKSLLNRKNKIATQMKGNIKDDVLVYITFEIIFMLILLLLSCVRG